MKVTEFIAQFLKKKGIDIVFELQGGMITQIIDALHHDGSIKIVSMHHEQAAAMAADAYGRINNKPGVALATSGPGATNLLTGIGCCFFDSVPAIFITGQVNTSEQKGDRSTRQIGFQETDIVSMARPITKRSYSIKAAKELPDVFEEAYKVAMTGRPGPVLIDIPMDIQSKEIGNAGHITYDSVSQSDSAVPGTFFQEYLQALRESKRPLILAGRGIRASGSVKEFKEFLKKIHIPVVSSLLGMDVLPFNHPERIGFIGTYGNRWANYALGTCDLLLVLGSRLDLRQTGSDTSSFQKGKQIFHIDIEEAELNNRITGCRTLKTSLFDFFKQIKEVEFVWVAPDEWIDEIRAKRTYRSDISELDDIKGINPNKFIHELSHASLKAVAFTVDVGNNQMWTSQSLELTEYQIFLTSGGMGSMGYALPAAIGASITCGNLPVVAIAGDGGFQINIQELQTIRRNNLPIKMVILNNHSLGMIRQFQDSYFKSCYQSSVWGYNTPDFAKVARAYGIESYSISRPEETFEGLFRLWENPFQPCLLEVTLDVFTNVFPKMMYGSPLSRMEPIIE